MKKRTGVYRNNTSGFRGVSYRGHYGGRWTTRIQVLGRLYHVGTYDRFADAKAARLAAEAVRDILQATEFATAPKTADVAEALRVGIASLQRKEAA